MQLRRLWQCNFKAVGRSVYFCGQFFKCVIWPNGEDCARVGGFFFLVVVVFFPCSSWHSLSSFLPTPDVRGGRSHTAASAAFSLTRVPHCRSGFPMYTLFPLYSNLGFWSTASLWDFLHVLRTSLGLHNLFLAPQQRPQRLLHAQAGVSALQLRCTASCEWPLASWISRGKRNHCVAYNKDVLLFDCFPSLERKQ